MKEKAYVLGTDVQELHRLGVQHQVWSAEARRAWETAEFSAGQRILDLGSGPGFCSTELAYITGKNGQVTAVDQSQIYINFLEAQANLHGLNINTVCSSFDEMELADDSLDGVYSRWALAWVNNAEEIIEKVVKAMTPGAVFVAHEYYDWKTFQSEPELPAFNKALNSALKSMGDAGGNINIGRKLAELFTNAGLEVIATRPMNKMAFPDDLSWQWPKTYCEIYFKKLVPAYLSEKEVEDALMDLKVLENHVGASILCPSMVEVIAAKP